MIDQLQVFFNKNHFVRFTTENLAGLIYDDMIRGLEKETEAFQPMIPVYGFLEERKQENQNILVIDAGGTNFRSCLVSFDSKGNASISELKKSKMPGIEKELSKEEFYNSIADRIDYLKNKADKIAVTKVTLQVDFLQNELNPLKDLSFLPFSAERKIYTERAWEEIEKWVNINGSK